MTDARTFKYRTNLARKMSAPGGRTVADAVIKAEAGVERHRAGAMASVHETLAALEAVVAARGEGGQGIYDLAASMLDMAGYFDTGPLHGAMFSLCELSSRMIEADRWEWPPVEVHVRALRVILDDDCRDSEGSRAVLEGLAMLVRKATR